MKRLLLLVSLICFSAYGQRFVNSYETMAAMVASASLNSTSTNILLLGYYAPNDGGGGNFYYDKTSSASTNLGTVVKPTLAAGRLIRVIENSTVNARMFGAKGDGVTDDSLAVQAMLDFTDETGRHGTMQFTTGHYRFSGVIGRGGKLEAVGHGEYGVDFGTGSGVFLEHTLGATNDMLMVNQGGDYGRSMTLENLTFYGHAEYNLRDPHLITAVYPGDRFHFDIADSSTVNLTGANLGTPPYAGFGFLYTDENRYLGSFQLNRFMTNGVTSATNTVWIVAGTDAYATVSGEDILRVGFKVCFPKSATFYYNGAPYTTKVASSMAGYAGVRLWDTVTCILNNCKFVGFHTGVAVNSHTVEVHGINTYGCQYSGIVAEPWGGTYADGQVDGWILLNGNYAADSELPSPTHSLTNTIYRTQSIGVNIWGSQTKLGQVVAGPNALYGAYMYGAANCKVDSLLLEGTALYPIYQFNGNGTYKMGPTYIKELIVQSPQGSTTLGSATVPNNRPSNSIPVIEVNGSWAKIQVGVLNVTSFIDQSPSNDGWKFGSLTKWPDAATNCYVSIGSYTDVDGHVLAQTAFGTQPQQWVVPSQLVSRGGSSTEPSMIVKRDENFPTSNQFGLGYNAGATLFFVQDGDGIVDDIGITFNSSSAINQITTGNVSGTSPPNIGVIQGEPVPDGTVDTAGGILQIRSGRGGGNGYGSQLQIATPRVDTSGAVSQTYDVRAHWDQTGAMFWYGMATNLLFPSNGHVWYNSVERALMIGENTVPMQIQRAYGKNPNRNGIVTINTEVAPASGTVTITISSPAVVTLAGHGAVANQPVVFTTTSHLPAGINANRAYYVSATGLTADEFQLLDTLGGSTVNTSGTQGGTHTAFFRGAAYPAAPSNWENVVVLGTTLTAGRSVTISSSGAILGQNWTFVRPSTSTGAFNWDIAGLKNLAADEWCDVEWNGTAYVLKRYGTFTAGGGGGAGTVMSVSVTTANGVSGVVADPTTTPAITLTLGAITPTSVNSVVLSGSSTPTLGVTGTSTISGNNTGDQTITLTSDVTGSGTGSFATTIANDAVTNAKMANMATQTIKGRTSGGTGDPEDLTATQATAILNAMVGDSGAGGTKGLAPAPAAGDAAANKFLKADGTWTAPAGGGDVVGPASATDNAAARFDSTTGKLIQNSSVIMSDAGDVDVTSLDINGTAGAGFLNLRAQSSSPFSPAANYLQAYADANSNLIFSYSSGYTYTLVANTITGLRSVYLPDANTYVAISPATITWAGLAAPRTYTLPNANAVIARTDAGQSFTGTQNFLGAVYGTGTVSTGVPSLHVEAAPTSDTPTVQFGDYPGTITSEEAVDINAPSGTDEILYGRLNGAFRFKFETDGDVAISKDYQLPPGQVLDWTLAGTRTVSITSVELGVGTASGIQINPDAASPKQSSVHFGSATGSNAAGAAATIYGSGSTGSGNGGDVKISVASASTGGGASNPNLWTTALTARGLDASVQFHKPVILQTYTVATLPTGVTGMIAYVTDATAPTYLGALTGGGAVVCPVFYNGSAWVSH